MMTGAGTSKTGGAGGNNHGNLDEVTDLYAHLGVGMPASSKKNSMLALPMMQSQGNSVSDTLNGGGFRNLPNRPSLCAPDSINRPQMFVRGGQQ